MITEILELLKCYAEQNDVDLDEAVSRYEKGNIYKVELLDAYLRNEGIYGYTTDIMNIFELFEDM